MVDLRPTFAQVDLGALTHNFKTIARHVGEARVLAVVKADAYGHGAVQASFAVVEAGAWGLAVSLVEEGVQLRAAGIDVPVVVLGGIAPNSEDVLVGHRLTPVVWDVDHLDRLRAAVRRAGAGPCPIHLKIDTGMTRLGVLPEDVSALAAWLANDAGATVTFEGLMTHLACADEVDNAATSLRQLQVFGDCAATLSDRGLTPKVRHACNSAGLVRFPQAHLDMVRPGIALYGAAASPDVKLDDLQQPMTLRSAVLGIREVPSGVRVSYGGRDQLRRPSRLAIVPVGYADGYARNMTGRAQMLIGGQRARVVGVITMDTTMLDVTDLDEVRAGEHVTLLGSQGSEMIGVQEMAQWAGTLSYEVMCGISKRVPRRYSSPAIG